MKKECLVRAPRGSGSCCPWLAALRITPGNAPAVHPFPHAQRCAHPSPTSRQQPEPEVSVSEVVAQRSYQGEELILLFRMKVQSGIGKENAAQMGQGDILRSAQEVLRH